MDLKKHLQNAEDAIKRRNWPHAIKVYRQLLAIQPDNGEARAGLRRALFRKAEQKAPSKLSAALFGWPHLLVGGFSRLINQHGGAAKAYERYLSMNPLSEGANLKLADSLSRTGHDKSALAVYKAFAEEEPRCLEASREAGALLYEQGHLDEALAMYEQALKVDPRDQESLKARKNLAAEGALKTTGIEKAKSSRDLIKDKKTHAKQEKSQRLQLSKEEVAAELEELEPQLAERPNDVDLLKKVGRLREQDKDRAGALDCYELALQQSPTDHGLAQTVGDLRLSVQEQRVRDAEARGDESAVTRAKKMLADARATEFKRRVDRQPTDLGLRVDLGSALLDQGTQDEAIAELQQGVKDPKRRTEAQWLLGRAFQEKGLDDLALGQWEKALTGAGSGSNLAKEVRYAIGDLHASRDRTMEALKHFEAILEQDIGYRDVSGRVESLRSDS